MMPPARRSRAAEPACSGTRVMVMPGWARREDPRWEGSDGGVVVKCEAVVGFEGGDEGDGAALWLGDSEGEGSEEGKKEGSCVLHF